MAFTQAQLDALRAAYAAGVQTVKHGDNSVTYASMADLRAAIREIEAQLAPPRSRVHYPAFERD